MKRENVRSGERERGVPLGEGQGILKGRREKKRFKINYFIQIFDKLCITDKFKINYI